MCIKFVMYADVPSYFVSCCVVYFIFIIFLFSASLVRFFDYSAECFFFLLPSLVFLLFHKLRHKCGGSVATLRVKK